MNALVPLLALVVDQLTGGKTWFPKVTRMADWASERCEERLAPDEGVVSSGAIFASVVLLALVASVVGAGISSLFFWLPVGLGVWLDFWLPVLLGFPTLVVISSGIYGLRGSTEAATRIAQALERGEGGRRTTGEFPALGKDVERKAETIRGTVRSLGEVFAEQVVGPLLYLGIGGLVLGLPYLLLTTLDRRMAGKRGVRYEGLRMVARALAGVARFIPERIAPVLIAAGAWMAAASWSGARRVMRRDTGDGGRAPRTVGALRGALLLGGGEREGASGGGAGVIPSPGTVRMAVSIVNIATLIGLCLQLAIALVVLALVLS